MAGPLNRQIRSSLPLPSHWHPHPEGGAYRTEETVKARIDAGEDKVVTMAEKDPFGCRTGACPEILPPDVSVNSLGRYRAATVGGATRAGDSFDRGASMWDEHKQEVTQLGDGISEIRAKAAHDAARTGAKHGYPDYPLFGKKSTNEAEPRGLPHFPKRTPPKSSNPFEENEEPKALLIEYDKKGRDLCLLYTSPSPRDRTRSRMPSSA